MEGVVRMSVRLRRAAVSVLAFSACLLLCAAACAPSHPDSPPPTPDGPAVAASMASASTQVCEAPLGGPEAFLLAAGVAATAVFLAVRRLESFELTETD